MKIFGNGVFDLLDITDVWVEEADPNQHRYRYKSSITACGKDIGEIFSDGEVFMTECDRLRTDEWQRKYPGTVASESIGIYGVRGATFAAVYQLLGTRDDKYNSLRIVVGDPSKYSLVYWSGGWGWEPWYLVAETDEEKCTEMVNEFRRAEGHKPRAGFVFVALDKYIRYYKKHIFDEPEVFVFQDNKEVLPLWKIAGVNYKPVFAVRIVEDGKYKYGDVRRVGKDFFDGSLSTEFHPEPFPSKKKAIQYVRELGLPLKNELGRW